MCNLGRAPAGALRELVPLAPAPPRASCHAATTSPGPVRALPPRGTLALRPPHRPRQRALPLPTAARPRRRSSAGPRGAAGASPGSRSSPPAPATPATPTPAGSPSGGCGRLRRPPRALGAPPLPLPPLPSRSVHHRRPLAPQSRPRCSPASRHAALSGLDPASAPWCRGPAGEGNGRLRRGLRIRAGQADGPPALQLLAAPPPATKEKTASGGPARRCHLVPGIELR
jgi:hypothetical protein